MRNANAYACLYDAFSGRYKPLLLSHPWTTDTHSIDTEKKALQQMAFESSPLPSSSLSSSAGSSSLLPPIPQASKAPEKSGAELFLEYAAQEAALVQRNGHEQFGEVSRRGDTRYDRVDHFAADYNDAYKEEAVHMDAAFYSGVDQFLSKPPPSLKQIISGGGRSSDFKQSKWDGHGRCRAPTAPPAQSHGVSGTRYDSSSHGSFSTGKVSGVGGRRSSGAESLDERGSLVKGSKPCQGNPFRALRQRGNPGPSGSTNTWDSSPAGVNSSMAMAAEGDPYSSARRVGGAPSGAKEKKRLSKGKGGGALAVDREFGVDADEHRSGIMAATDIDSLVANFDQGIEIARLRSELAASQHRLASSSSALSSAAAEFYSGRS